MIADTPCKHMFLIETFDAWEPWDSIHQYPSKVGREICAYSHAAVLAPFQAVRVLFITAKAWTICSTHLPITAVVKKATTRLPCC